MSSPVQAGEWLKNQTVVTEDGVRICCDLFCSGHPEVVVIAHGFFNSKEAILLQALADVLKRDTDVCVLDFRGHGRSGGLFSWTAKEPQDLEAVLQTLRAAYGRVGVVGFSLGAAISIITAAETDLIDSLVAVSAPVAFEKIEFHFWDLDFENDILFNLGPGKQGKGVRPGPLWHKKIKPLDCIGRVKAPVLLIHGTGDWLIRPWHSEALYTKVKSRSQIMLIPDGPHAEYLIRKNKEQTVRCIQNWFKETLCRQLPNG